MPPARWHEVSQTAGPQLDPVLRPPISDDSTSLSAASATWNSPAGSRLRSAIVECYRQDAVVTEADIDNPRPWCVHPQHQMVEGRAQPGRAEHPGRQQGYVESKSTQEQGEGAVQFVAEPASPPTDEFAEQWPLLQLDRLVQMNAEILERDRHQVSLVEVLQHRIGHAGWAHPIKSRQIAIDRVIIHRTMIPGPPALRPSARPRLMFPGPLTLAPDRMGRASSALPDTYAVPDQRDPQHDDDEASDNGTSRALDNARGLSMIGAVDMAVQQPRLRLRKHVRVPAIRDALTPTSGSGRASQSDGSSVQSRTEVSRAMISS
jgi:hypothetical protein